MPLPPESTVANKEVKKHMAEFKRLFNRSPNPDERSFLLWRSWQIAKGNDVPPITEAEIRRYLTKRKGELAKKRKENKEKAERKRAKKEKAKEKEKEKARKAKEKAKKEKEKEKKQKSRRGKKAKSSK